MDRITMFQGKNYYQILGVPENATHKQIQKAYHTLAFQEHEDMESDESKKPAAKERMEAINAAYEVIGDEKLRRNYDNKYALNGGSQEQWIKDQAILANRALNEGVQSASEEDAAVIEFFLSESLGDYRYSKNVKICTDWLLKLVNDRPDMAGHAVNAAFKMALHENDFTLLDALLEKAPGSFRYDKVNRFAENIKGRTFGVADCYRKLADIFCARYRIARDNGTLEKELQLVSEFFAVPALQEQVSGDPGGLLLTLLKYAPGVITQHQFNSYNRLVYKLGWTHHGDQREHNESMIKKIMEVRPDLIRLPQEAYERKFSLTLAPWQNPPGPGMT